VTRLPVPVPDTIRLAGPITAGGLPLWDLIRSRRSRRRYAAKPIPLDAIAQLAWAAQGETGRVRGEARRAVPSAGALYPLETYIAVGMAEGIAPGLYHYESPTHAFTLVGAGDSKSDVVGPRFAGDSKSDVVGPRFAGDSKSDVVGPRFAGDLRRAIAEAALGQEMFLEAAVIFVWTAVWSRSRDKYGERADRYVYLEAGHAAQNVALAAEALGLSSCQAGSFYDDEIARLVGADGVEESPLYLTAVGARARSR